MNGDRLDEAERHASPARRGWMGGITGAPPAGPGWRVGRSPPFASYLLAAFVTTIFVVLLFFLLV